MAANGWHSPRAGGRNGFSARSVTARPMAALPRAPPPAAPSYPVASLHAGEGGGDGGGGGGAGATAEAPRASQAGPLSIRPKEIIANQISPVTHRPVLTKREGVLSPRPAAALALAPPLDPGAAPPAIAL